jgi:hypothetical protein
VPASHRFQNLAEAHRLIGEFITRYNTEWLITEWLMERLGHQTPVAARAAGPSLRMTELGQKVSTSGPTCVNACIHCPGNLRVRRSSR